jgi:hypothetical protein
MMTSLADLVLYCWKMSHLFVLTTSVEKRAYNKFFWSVPQRVQMHFYFNWQCTHIMIILRLCQKVQKQLLIFMIKFVSALQQVRGVPRIPRFPPSNKTDRRYITEIFLKVPLNQAIILTLTSIYYLHTNVNSQWHSFLLLYNKIWWKKLSFCV